MKIKTQVLKLIFLLTLTLSIIIGTACLAETINNRNAPGRCASCTFYYHHNDEEYGFCFNCGTLIPGKAKAKHEQAYMAMTCVQNTLTSPRSMEVERVTLSK